ncbi:FAD binding domain-containing protein [Chlamydoabsidia padenii]|nr:FAD binding domain-containing protein [Chlamydoabsidia padenii]
MKQIVDIIVNGAGPVGLFLAYLLIKAGHSVYLLDKKDGPTEQSRAFNITPRSLEILQHYGLAHRILQQALNIRGALLYVNGSNIGETFFEEVDCVFPQLTSLGQSNVERIFMEEIEKLQGKIEWKTELVGYEQLGDHVVARVKNGDSDTKEISAKYIVGADGCHSKVRKQNPSWTYEGHSIKSQFALADLVLEGPDISRIRNRQVVFYHSKGGCILIPLPHQGTDDQITLRMVANLGSYETNDGSRVTHGVDNPREVLTLDKVKELMDERIVGLKLNIKKSLWLTYFNVNERIANGFRRGRAFLVGDAAHCHSPAGGQGMNIGFHDAENLAWKLSLALNGESSDPEKLLDSYTIEREPMVKAVMTTAGTMSRVLLADSYIMGIIRYLAITTALSIPPIRRNIVNRLLQIDFKLGESPILAKSGTNQHTLIQHGQFIKDTRALLNKNVAEIVERKTIYQIMEPFSNKHLIFWVITRQTWQHEPETELTNAFINGIAGYNACRGLVFQSISQYGQYNDDNLIIKDKKKVDHWIDTHAISSTDSLSSRLGFTTYLTSTKSNTPPAAMVVLRPDRYVAYSSLVSNLVELEHAFTFLNGYLLQNK